MCCILNGSLSVFRFTLCRDVGLLSWIAGTFPLCVSLRLRLSPPVTPSEDRPVGFDHTFVPLQ